MLDRQFPGQEASDFAYAINYNSADVPASLTGLEVSSLSCIQIGANDYESWIWEVTMADGSRWRVEGWCDYTGWDCQSGTEWKNL